MLQSTVRTQLARLKIKSSLDIGVKRFLMSPEHLGPTKYLEKGVKNELTALRCRANQKHFAVDYIRSIVMAKTLLYKRQIIAVPTDTVYGLAGLALDNKSIDRLYEIKKRDENKPLAICVSDIKDIQKWGNVDDLPPDLLEELLPGPVTIVLKRTEALNPALNPNIDNVGIRVPDSKFIRNVAKIAGPLALTSANESNKPSSLHPEEFEELWPMLGAIFHGRKERPYSNDHRKGSTIVDLTNPGHYRILRKGIGCNGTTNILRRHGLKYESLKVSNDVQMSCESLRA